MLLGTSRFITSEIDPARGAYIGEMIDHLKNDKARGRSASDEAIAETVGFIAVSLTPLTIGVIAESTERDYSVIKRAASALNNVGFIEKNIAPRNDGNGKPPTLLIPKPELYEGIALTPNWQAAVRTCMLAAISNMTTVEVIDDAVKRRLSDFTGVVRLGDPA